MRAGQIRLDRAPVPAWRELPSPVRCGRGCCRAAAPRAPCRAIPARSVALETKPWNVRDDRDQSGPQHSPRQERSREQSAYVGRRLGFEYQPEPHPHDPNLGMVAFDEVEFALDRDLVPGIERALNPVGRPRFVDQAILRSRRGMRRPRRHT